MYVSTVVEVVRVSGCLVRGEGLLKKVNFFFGWRSGGLYPHHYFENYSPAKRFIACPRDA